jgi:hypothetical protein
MILKIALIVVEILFLCLPERSRGVIQKKIGTKSRTM